MQVGERQDLAGGVTHECQGQLVGDDPGSVVADSNRRPAGAADLHRDPASVGVERVLDQLLHHRRRTLDHLAGGDGVGHLLLQSVDSAHESRRALS